MTENTCFKYNFLWVLPPPPPWQVTVMKGTNRNKDHSTDGEGTGKRPKRKCLQWHPLLAKKILDFSEEEDEDEDEEDIDKVYLYYLKVDVFV